MKDFSIYVNSAEKIQQANNRKRFYQKYRIFLAAVIALVLCCAVIAHHYRQFHSFVKTKTVVEENSSSQNIEVYKDGIIKYGENQIAYYDKNGNKSWSRTYSVSKPQIKISGKYILIADLNGTNLYIYDDKGKSYNITAPYQIMDAEIADQGVVAVALSAKKTNYIELYNRSGEKLVSIKTSISENGYPLDIALSPNGEILCASYFIVDGVEMKNRLTFYDFSEDGEKTKNILGGFDCDNTVVPTVTFMGSDTVCAFGDDKILVYQINNKPKLKKETAIESSIKSIAYDSNHFAIVRGHYTDEKDGNYTLEIFSKNGNMVGKCGIDGDYTTINLRNDKVIFTSPYHCTVYSSNGKVLFDYSFTKHLLQLLPGSGDREYFIGYEDRLDMIKLK
ncbi:MAG: DUF5711 family protein [Lachnospiraceae bacterium]|nr:DUF5711 family protein [Lachnospiraceae bacterium]